MPKESTSHRNRGSLSPIKPPLRRPTDRLKAERVQKELRQMPGWQAVRNGAVISRVFRFHGKATPMLFAALVDGLAREEGRQPTLTVDGHEVTCQLTSREVGGVTLRDLDLAKRISLLEQ